VRVFQKSYVDIQQDFFAPFPLDEIFCFLVLCLIFLQLEILESKQSSQTHENRRQWLVLQKGTGNAAEHICCPVFKRGQLMLWCLYKSLLGSKKVHPFT
jgi:hypothetical protein